MNHTMHPGAAPEPGAVFDQASAEVWEIVRDLEAVLPPAQTGLVHKLRLAAELVGAMRAARLERPRVAPIIAVPSRSLGPSRSIESTRPRTASTTSSRASTDGGERKASAPEPPLKGETTGWL